MTTVAVFRRYNNDVLESADTVTLSDTTGVYGIKRVSDGTLMLAPTGTGVTNPSTGVYQYDYTALALDPTYSYYIYWKAVKSGFDDLYVTETIQSADTSRTLLGYRRAMGRSGKFGRWGLYTTTEAATGSDATRTLISTSLIDLVGQPTKYNNAYPLITSGALAGTQRRVTDSGFTGSVGALLLNRTLGATAALGVDFEVWHRLPALPQDDQTSIRDLLNQALGNLYTVRTLTLTGVTDQQVYSVAAYPWLQRQEQIGPIYAVETDSTKIPARHSGGAQLHYNGSTPVLWVPVAFDTADSIKVDVAQPCNTYIRSGGTWGDSTVGLVDDSDAAMADPDLVREMVLAFYWEALAELVPSERKFWSDKAAAQHIKAAQLRGAITPKMEPSTRKNSNQPLGYGGSGSLTGGRLMSDVNFRTARRWR